MSASVQTRSRPRPASHARARPHRVAEPLGRYTDDCGRQREVVCRAGANGSRLVIDRLASTLGDQRLVAHLAADERADNSHVVTSLYLADAEGRYCRRLAAHDLTSDPFPTAGTDRATALDHPIDAGEARLIDPRGYTYRLQATRNAGSIPELRWHRTPPGEAGRDPEVVSARHMIGAVESYEPARALTTHAVAAHDRDETVSVCALRAELDRVNASRIVLNRGLREAVLVAVNERGLSMSEIALRCGREKRDANGTASGETSWLGRRIGLLPEGGHSEPTPWVSSEVLALIARQGLAMAPHEVELG
jgi:hypothetical protein